MSTAVKCAHSHRLSGQAFLLKAVWAPSPPDLGGRVNTLHLSTLRKGAHSSAHAINAPSLTPVAFLGKCERRAPQVTRSLGSLSSLSLCELLSLPSLPLALSQKQDVTQPSATTQPLTMPRMETCLHPALQHPTQMEGLRPWHQPRPGFQDSCPWELGWREGQ